MNVREEQVALTRRAIVDAFMELSGGLHAKPVTIAEVARHSGISPATIYRHFANRDALVSAAAAQNFNIVVPREQREWTLEDLRAHCLVLWSEFAANMQVIREATVSEAGREMRRARWQLTRTPIQEKIAVTGANVDTAEVRHITAAVELLTSAHAFLDFHDRQGLSVTESVDAAIGAVYVLLRAIVDDPASLRFAIPSTPVVPEETP
jgi:AcrR family transcriptional regulator